MLRTDLLGAWAGWLTPVFEPRRYRTWFFVAALPEGQRTRDVSTESVRGDLAAGAEAPSTAVDAGELLMLPPTYLTCLEVAQYADRRARCSRPRTAGPVEMFTPGGRGARARARRCRSPTALRAAAGGSTGVMSGLGRRVVRRAGARACSRPTPR